MLSKEFEKYEREHICSAYGELEKCKRSLEAVLQCFEDLHKENYELQPALKKERCRGLTFGADNV